MHLVQSGPISEPVLVLPTIGRALGLRDDERAPGEAWLIDRLPDCEELLVLDNMEPLVDAGTQLVDLP